MVRPFSPISPPDEFPYALFEDIDFAATEQTPVHVTSWRTDVQTTRFTFQLAENGYADCSARSMYGFAIYPGGSGSTDTGTTPIDVKFPAFGDHAAYFCQVSQGEDLRQIFVRTDPLPASIEIPELQLLPRILDAQAQADPIRPTVTWTVDREADEDMVMIQMGGSPNWRIVAPPHVRTIRMPDLPPDLRVTFSDPPSFRVEEFDATFLAGYHDAIRDIYALFIAEYLQPLGTISSTRWGD
jgi:hypothetical protein